MDNYFFPQQSAQPGQSGQSQLAQLQAGQSQPAAGAVLFWDAANAPKPRASPVTSANAMKRDMILPLSGR